MFGKAAAEYIIKILSQGEKFYYVDKIFDIEKVYPVPRLILLLPGKGCSWSKKTGGCYMCGFKSKLDKVNDSYNYSSRDIIALCKLSLLMTKTQRCEKLYIYNGGSFFNEKEISLDAQYGICKIIAQNPSIRELMVESRPEFITAGRFLVLKRVLGEKNLTVGIGLECQDDNIRNASVNKGFSRNDFNKAADVILSYKGKLFVYVFLKPLYLSEREAIEEAVRTIQYSFEKGASIVSLSCAFIQENTKMAEEYERGNFRPPWLWSIMEVIRRAHDLGYVHIGSFEDEPPPIAVPYNCSKCSKEVMNILQEYNLTRDLKVFDQLSCTCKKEWEDIIRA
ncbi:MAG: archaeosine biosynthesis radical SAM protein RaSEA [bacterium]